MTSEEIEFVKYLLERKDNPRYVYPQYPSYPTYPLVTWSGEGTQLEFDFGYPTTSTTMTNNPRYEKWRAEENKRILEELNKFRKNEKKEE